MGLIVSLCTGIMTRVRLCDLMALLYRQGLQAESSFTRFGLLGENFISILEGTTNLNYWINQKGEREENKGDAGERKEPLRQCCLPLACCVKRVPRSRQASVHIAIDRESVPIGRVDGDTV